MALVVGVIQDQRPGHSRNPSAFSTLRQQEAPRGLGLGPCLGMAEDVVVGHLSQCGMRKKTLQSQPAVSWKGWGEPQTSEKLVSSGVGPKSG